MISEIKEKLEIFEKELNDEQKEVLKSAYRHPFELITPRLYLAKGSEIERDVLSSD